MESGRTRAHPLDHLSLRVGQFLCLFAVGCSSAPAPRVRVVHRPEPAPEAAAAERRFGADEVGSGEYGVYFKGPRFDSRDELNAALSAHAQSVCEDSGYLGFDWNPTSPEQAIVVRTDGAFGYVKCHNRSAMPEIDEDVTSFAATMEVPAPSTDGRESSHRPLSTEEIAERGIEATVWIFVNNGGSVPARGSGFHLGNGYVVTNYHVIEGARAIAVMAPDDKSVPVSRVAAFDASSDLAIIRAPGLRGTPKLDLADDPPKPGAQVIVVGNPMDLRATVSDGIISGTKRLENVELLQITAPISQGSSGGPVIDGHGQVVGAALAFYKEGQNLNFAVSARHIRQLLRKRHHFLLVPEFGELTSKDTAPTAPRRTARPGTRAPFPAQVAGFRFGADLAAANARCQGQLQGTPKFAVCPFLPVSVPFAVDGAGLGFEAGALTEIGLSVKDWPMAVRALLRRYGPPTDFWAGKNGRTVSSPTQWEFGMVGRAAWQLAEGYILLASDDGERLLLMYYSGVGSELRQSSY